MIDTAANPSVNVTDMYMSVLASLSVDSRLDLIAKLTASIKKDSGKTLPKENLRTLFCGDWNDIPLREETYHGREIICW